MTEHIHKLPMIWTLYEEEILDLEIYWYEIQLKKIDPNITFNMKDKRSHNFIEAMDTLLSWKNMPSNIYDKAFIRQRYGVDYSI